MRWCDVRTRSRPQRDEALRFQRAQRGEHVALVDVELVGERAHRGKLLAARIPADMQTGHDPAAERVGDGVSSYPWHEQPLIVVRALPLGAPRRLCAFFVRPACLSLLRSEHIDNTAD